MKRLLEFGKKRRQKFDNYAKKPVLSQSIRWWIRWLLNLSHKHLISTRPMNAKMSLWSQISHLLSYLVQGQFVSGKAWNLITRPCMPLRRSNGPVTKPLSWTLTLKRSQQISQFQTNSTLNRWHLKMFWMWLTSNNLWVLWCNLVVKQRLIWPNH